uniref:Uncharacterized protein n=1 Tax=Glycine max TaxID=3847 RepID=A0A0R0HCJ6_SOYBN
MKRSPRVPRELRVIGESGRSQKLWLWVCDGNRRGWHRSRCCCCYSCCKLKVVCSKGWVLNPLERKIRLGQRGNSLKEGAWWWKRK